ncbi:hypothetical protein C9J47_11850 [Photobacterium indicum]|uniref:Transposase IS801/IS1294 domain-containing protein n=1 Tax=Photobacterium indicum TaxID=81447 RepID=A0A2T3L982_9GAMM|nr:transposase [Photobacterium indicum]PSV47555.1 hypothetical protein C9J47_11850 [Photobacterium indicum]
MRYDKLTKRTVWVVDCRHVGQGKSALLYLSKCLYRGVLADNNILYKDNGNITFRYLDSQTKADYFCPCCHHLMRCLGVFRPR